MHYELARQAIQHKRNTTKMMNPKSNKSKTKVNYNRVYCDTSCVSNKRVELHMNMYLLQGITVRK